MPSGPHPAMNTTESDDGGIQRTGSTWRLVALWVVGAVGFCTLATLNSGGYRYGTSDQAFYIPVVLEQIDPTLFPHDKDLIAAQDRFLFFDDWFAPLVRLTGLSLPLAFLFGQILTLLVLYGAIVAIGLTMFRSRWTVAGLVALMTIRHRIPHTGANSVEGYFHPRLLAFAVGLSAMALYLSGRTRLALGVVLVAFLIHPTIGFWYAILIGCAAVLSGGVSLRRLLIWASAPIAVGGLLLGESLLEQFVLMDEAWVTVLGYKDYLVMRGWPLAAWPSNLAIAAFVFLLYWYRRSLGVTTDREGALVAGCGLLVAVFLCSAPLSYAPVALAVQLQINRVFWLVDYVGVVFFAWLLFESPLRARARAALPRVTPRRAFVVFIAVMAMWRGGYRGFVERPGQPVVEVGFADTDWTELMGWASRQPVGTHFLADPGHAGRYGTSVRVASGRDVYLELIKDSALAIYSSEIAGRVARRVDDIGDFSQLTEERAGVLARQYELDFLITERRLDLPVVYEVGALTAYRLHGTEAGESR